MNSRATNLEIIISQTVGVSWDPLFPARFTQKKQKKSSIGTQKVNVGQTETDAVSTVRLIEKYSNILIGRYPVV